MAKNPCARQETRVQSHVPCLLGLLHWQVRSLPLSHLSVCVSVFIMCLLYFVVINGGSQLAGEDYDLVDRIGKISSPLDCKEIKPGNPKGNQS